MSCGEWARSSKSGPSNAINENRCPVLTQPACRSTLSGHSDALSPRAWSRASARICASARVAAVAAALGATVWLLPTIASAASDPQPVAFVPEARALPNKVLLLDAAKAGKRFVVVGERGRILYTDDD